MKLRKCNRTCVIVNFKDNINHKNKSFNAVHTCHMLRKGKKIIRCVNSTLYLLCPLSNLFRYQALELSLLQ